MNPQHPKVSLRLYRLNRVRVRVSGDREPIASAQRCLLANPVFRYNERWFNLAVTITMASG
jgi:hypothetical protein